MPDAAHEVGAVCPHCGYDLDERGCVTDTCTDCGKALKLQQDVVIQVTTLPPMFGGVM